VDASPPPGLTGNLLKAHLKAGTALLLLDGLDEVPVSETRDGITIYPRELLLTGLADALVGWQKAKNRILLTSRPYGLDEAGLHRLGLSYAALELLPRPLQELFVSRWFHALGRRDLIPRLIDDIRGRGDLAPLVENPMLLTAICVLHHSGYLLPEDRYELYKRITNNVLHHRFPGGIRQREPVKARLEAIALGMHIGDADSPRVSPAAEISYLETERLLRDFAEEDPSYEYRRVEPAARREELLTGSGLLLPRPNDRAAFYHPSFQEYLAAERILRAHDDLESIFRERGAVAEWRPTLMFLFAGKIASKTPRWGSDLLEKLIKEQDRPKVKANPTSAVFIAEALDLYLVKQYPVPETLKQAFRRLSLDAIEDEVELRARQALGLCLGRLGDPRIRSLRDPEAYVEVPAGSYPYGDDNEASVEVKAPFWIGRYPVTNSQYQVFIGDGGYRDPRWWSAARLGLAASPRSDRAQLLA
jgi:Sulfatase-modifying factor enzyme 1